MLVIINLCFTLLQWTEHSIANSSAVFQPCFLGLDYWIILAMFVYIRQP